IVPCCFGRAGRCLAAHRASLAALAGSAALAELSPPLAGALPLPPAVSRVIDGTLTTHATEVYVTSWTTADSPPLPRAAAATWRESAMSTLAAADAIDAAIAAACPWLDEVLGDLEEAVTSR